jgi:large subunit ribosomal protein L16
MGKGKGNPEFWAAVVEPGRIIFEADGVFTSSKRSRIAKEANCSKISSTQKLPIKTKFVKEDD